MARLHPLLGTALDRLPRETPVHLLTRHSVREQAEGSFADYRLGLTEEGVTLAEHWGAGLDRPVTCWSSSPVDRCRDTAHAMQRGALRDGHSTHAGTVREAEVLVEPGSYVHDAGSAWPVFVELGARAFINRHLNEGLDGVCTPAVGRAQLIRHLRAHEPRASTLAVHVTHDTVLAAFVAGLCGWTRLDPQDWPWMLEGLWLWFAEDRLHWIWRGEPGSRPLA